MPQSSKTFRIFVSSTFSDLKEERNALQKYVFPKLRELCAQHGCRFQAIDLRWGVSEEAGLDQQTMNICLQEIERSQETSPKPNFIILLGDRYGWQPLPSEIHSDEFERIVDNVYTDDEKELLLWKEEQPEDKKGWYREDLNAVPPVYCLQPRKGIYGKYENWTPVEQNLHSILLKAASKLGLDDGDFLKYHVSATHQEIIEGALEVEDANEHVFGFFREITNLDDIKRCVAHPPQEIPEEEFKEIINQLEDKEKELLKMHYLLEGKNYILKLEINESSGNENYELENKIYKAVKEGIWKSSLDNKAKEKYFAMDFVDIIKEQKKGKITVYNAFDNDAHEKLINLKEELEKKLSDNITCYNSTWNNGLSLDHIGTLPEDVIEKTGANEDIGDPNTLCVAVWNRLYKVINSEVEKQEKADPLEEEINAHKRFGEDRCRFFEGRTDILDDIGNYINGDSDSPLVICGKSGSGKSALIAKAIKNEDNEFYNRITDSNENIIIRFIGATPESSDIKLLIKSLYIQISKKYGITDFSVPTEYKDILKAFHESLNLPNSGKPLILFLDALDQMSNRNSAHDLNWLPRKIPENVKIIVSTLPNDIYYSLKNKIPKDNILRLEPLNEKEGIKILDLWLNDENRRLTKEQLDEILVKFNENNSPLYLKLAFEEAKKWKSYTINYHLEPEISGIIKQMFNRLSLPQNHGKVLVSHVLGYLSAAKNGLTEDEILDILALDKEVFDLTLKFHKPTEEKLPVALWSRLYFDLEPYITERNADETSLISFYHRQIAEIAEKEYLNQDIKMKRHCLLAEYFNEQNLKFKKDDNEIINIRKVSELPYQQTNANLIKDLHKTLTDLMFIDSKCSAGLSYDLIIDYGRLGLGIELGPPIVTSNKYNNGYGVFCPFCSAWFGINENELGTVITCIYCDNELKINSFSINKPWQPSEASKSYEKSFNDHIDLKTYKPDLTEFAEFLYRNSNSLYLFPDITFQLALNEPDNSNIFIQAKKIINTRENFIWINYLNKPQIKEPYVMNIFDKNHWFTSFAYLPNGENIVISSVHGQNKILNTKTGEELNEFYINPNFKLKTPVYCECSFQGTKIAFHSEWKFINIFDYNLNEIVFSLPLNYQKQIKSLKNNLYFPIISKIILFFYGNSKSIFNFPKTYEGIKFINEKTIIVENQSHDLEIWDIKKKEKISIFNNSEIEGYGLSLSPDGNFVATARGSILYVNSLKDNEKIILQGNSNIERINFSPDGNEILTACRDNNLYIWNIKTKSFKTLEGHYQDIESCNYSPDGKKIISCTRSESMNSNIIIWDAKNGEKISKINLKTFSIYNCGFSPDGNFVVTASFDKTIKIWNLVDLILGINKETESFPFSSRYIVKFTPNGKELLTDSESHLNVWNINTAKKMRTFEVKNYELIHNICYSPDGELLVLIKDKIEILYKNNEKYKKITQGPTDFKNEKTLMFSPDGKTFIYYKSRGFSSKLVLRNMITQKEDIKIPILKESTFSSFSISPDDKMILISMNKELYAFNISSYSLHSPNNLKINSFFNYNFSHFIERIIFSNSGKYIALNMNKEFIIVYKLFNNSEFIKISESANLIFFSYDDNYIISSFGKELKVIDIKTGERLTTFITDGDILSFDVFGNNIMVSDDLGKSYNLQLSVIENNPAIVTPVRKFLFKKNSWDKNITYTCVWCGESSKINKELECQIKKINKILDKQQSPILDLPEKCWNQKELSINCPFCNKPLKINPYLVDNEV